MFRPRRFKIEQQSTGYQGHGFVTVNRGRFETTEFSHAFGY